MKEQRWKQLDKGKSHWWLVFLHGAEISRTHRLAAQSSLLGDFFFLEVSLSFNKGFPDNGWFL